jgi:hypothetical protein
MNFVNVKRCVYMDSVIYDSYFKTEFKFKEFKT